MKEIAYDLEARKGYNVLQCIYSEGDIVPTDEELLRLADAHYRKIDLSDGIYVVNIGGYIGESVKKEIEYAEQQGKEVIYHIDQMQQAKGNSHLQVAEIVLTCETNNAVYGTILLKVAQMQTLTGGKKA